MDLAFTGPNVPGAICAQTDPELFFPEKGGSVTGVKEAKRMCMMCEHREACLQWALDNNERHGVWGGLTEGERKKLRAKRKREAAAAAAAEEQSDDGQDGDERAA